jgi:hypothetical protein
MDGRGRWMDNVFIERLWRSLKYESYVGPSAHARMMQPMVKPSSRTNSSYNNHSPVWSPATIQLLICTIMINSILSD